MTGDRVAQNKRTVMAFYDLTLNRCQPAEAVERYVRDLYIQHNPGVGDGKDPFISYFERMETNTQARKSYSRCDCRRQLRRAARAGDPVHAEQFI